MYRMRSWSVRHVRWLKALYAVWESLLRLMNPLFRLIGYRRIDGTFVAIERVTKGFLLDSRGCGQCIVSYTGMSSPMNCPKQIRNGPCGGVRDNGKCEVDPNMNCVWVKAWEGNKRAHDGDYPIQIVQPAVDFRLIGTSAWLREVRQKANYTGPEVVANSEV